MLSSDVLEEQFGPTQVEVVFQDKNNRVIRTKTLDGQVLEVSWVVFAPDADKRFPEPYSAMLAGESMGKAFRSRGIEFYRQVNDARPPDLPAAFKPWFGDLSQATVINVSILAGPESLPFAKIVETYRPEVDGSKLLGSDM